MKKRIGKIYLEKDNKNYFIVNGNDNLIKKNNEISINDLTSSNTQDKKYVTISGTYDWRVTASEDQCTEEYMQNIINTHFKNPDELSELEYAIYEFLTAYLTSLLKSKDHTIYSVFNPRQSPAPEAKGIRFNKKVFESDNNEYRVYIDELNDNFDNLNDNDYYNTFKPIALPVLDILKQYFNVELYICFVDLTIEFPDKFNPKYSIVWNYGFSGYYTGDNNDHWTNSEYCFPLFDGHDIAEYPEGDHKFKSITLFNNSTNSRHHFTKNFTALFFVLSEDKESVPQIYKFDFINKLGTSYTTYVQTKMANSTLNNVSSLSLNAGQPA